MPLHCTQMAGHTNGSRGSEQKSVHFVQNLNGNALVAPCAPKLCLQYITCSLVLRSEFDTFSWFSKHHLSQKQSPFPSLFQPLPSFSSAYCECFCKILCSTFVRFCFTVTARPLVGTAHCAVRAHIYLRTLSQFPIQLLATNSTFIPTLLCPFFPSLSLLLNLLFPDLCTGACSPIICFL